MSKVLVVEDEQHLADGLRFNLEAEGYQVQVTDTGESALEVLNADPAAFDVVVLDVMLPGKDGFSVMSEMRGAGQFVPTLMLTARGHPERRSERLRRGRGRLSDQAFRSGHSDRPDPRTAAPARMAHAVDEHGGQLHRRAQDVFKFGDKSVDFDRLELRVREQTFPLTLMEANVLRYLIQHDGKPVSRKKMLEEVWNLHEDTDTRAIDNFIVRLRRYIEDDPAKPRHVLTVRGVGYRFVAAPDKEE